MGLKIEATKIKNKNLNFSLNVIIPFPFFGKHLTPLLKV